MGRIKRVFNKKPIMLITIFLLIILIALGVFAFHNRKPNYNDADYLIIDRNGTLIGFSEYNLTKNKLVRYYGDGSRKKGTYTEGDNLVLLVKKEKKEELVIPSTVKKIEKDLFIDVDYIKTINIKMNVKKIEDEMFMDTSFENVILSKNIKSIGSSAFMNNLNLKKVTGNIEEIGDSAFENCVSLKSINLKKAKVIGDNAFKGCNSIKELYLSKSLETVGKDAFKYLANQSIIYVENLETKFVINGKFTNGKTVVRINKDYFKK